MRQVWKAAAGAAIVIVLAGCAGMPDLGQSAAPAPAAVTGPPLAAAEQDFANDVAAKGMYEIEISKLAAERAQSPQVRALAQAMVRERTRVHNELIALMASRGVSPPRSLSAEKAHKLQKLASVPRSDAFDNGYVRVVGIEDHQGAIAQFEKAKRDVKDKELRAWMTRTLATMRSHLASAKQVAAAMAG